MAKTHSAGSLNLLGILETDDQYALMLVNKMILGLLESVDYKSKLGYKICSGMEASFTEFFEAVGSTFPVNRKKEKNNRQVYSGPPQNNKVEKKDWEALTEYFEAQVAMYEEEKPKKSAFLKNLKRLTKLVGFNQLQKETLSYVYAIFATDPSYSKFFSDVLHGQSSKFPAFIAIAMGAPEKYKDIAKYFGQSGVFSRYGLIEYEGLDADDEGIPLIEEFLKMQMSDSDIADEDLVEALIGKATETELTVKDNFPHLALEAGRIEKIVKAAQKQKKRGVNIVISGPTGSGKTEFVKALAKMMDMNLFAIGESEADNTQFSADDQKVAAKRISSLLRAQAILKGQEKTILLMDEFEDFVSNKSDSSKQADPDSKIALNRLLEENFTVTFYNCNDINKFHDSFRNRFFSSLFIGYQPTKIRQNIWAHHLKSNGLKHDLKTALSLARRYEAPPRNIGNACSSVALQGGDIALIHDVMQDAAKISKGQGFAFDTSYEVPENYDVNLISSPGDVKQSSQSLQNMSSQNAPHTLLIEGKAGTGKSTYAYYQAEKMVRSVIAADMKDIVIPTQFATPEMNMVGAFMSALNTNSLLVLDNMEAMFQNISDGDKESLMETFGTCVSIHKAPIILTTQDRSLIDEGFRAFMDDEIKFTAMDEEMHKKAAKTIFGNKMIPDFRNGVAIGDFSRAARSVRSMPEVAANKKVIERRIAASASSDSGASLGFVKGNQPK